MFLSTRSKVAALVVTSLVACGTPHDLGITSSSSLQSCPWDPGFGLDSCNQGDWWLEFSVTDAQTTDVKVEVQGTSRVIDLPAAFGLGDGNLKFYGGPDDGPLPAGSMIRVTAYKGNQSATTGWFPYMQGAPALDCSDGDGGTSGGDAGTSSDASPNDAKSSDGGAEACAPSCSGKQCGGDGCGGSCGVCGGGTTCSNGACVSGCVPAWSPDWQQTSYASGWWTEYVVDGGGSLPRSVTFEVVGGASYPLSYGYGKWTGGLDGLAAGSTVVLHATDATGATAKTAPFAYLVEQAPKTDPCGGTPSTNSSCVPLARGMLTFTMDDSYESQDTLAKPVLDPYGFKATIYNITQQLSDYGELPFAQDLAADGMEVGSHTVHHLDLTTLSTPDVDAELSQSQAYLAANVGAPVTSFATPMGSYNAAVKTEIGKYYTSHRTVNPGLNYMGSDVLELNSDGVYDSSTPSAVCSWIQNAANKRGWEILMFHDFTTATTTSYDLQYPIGDFAKIVQCAAQTANLDVVTTSQGAARIRCASP